MQVTEVLRAVRTRAFVILGLSGLAVAQPLLDLFGRNPEFFIAGRYDTVQIVWFALIVAFVPPLVGIAVVAGASLLGRPVGNVAYVAVVGLLATALALGVFRWLGIDRAVAVILLSLAAGAGLTVLVVRTRGGRLFASVLAAANVLFVASFLLFSPTAELVASDGSLDVGPVEVPAVRGPVVVIVLDEMPAATLMRADGTLNAERYPGFAKLAAASTWFRNASSPHAHTPQGVPANLTGDVSDGTRSADLRRPPAERVHAARAGGAGAPLRGGDRPLPAVDLRARRRASRCARRSRTRRSSTAIGCCPRSCVTSSRRSTTRGAPTAPTTRTATATSTAVRRRCRR